MKATSKDRFLISASFRRGQPGRRPWIWFVNGLAGMLVVGIGGAFGHEIDTGEHTPPHYDAFAPPSVGGSYVDPVFGTRIRRLSEAGSTPNPFDGEPLAFITGEYATMTPFNKDNRRLLLQHQSYYALYDADGGYIRDLPYQISASSEPRWSRHDANVLYFLSGNELRQYDVARDEVRLVRAFRQYSRITGNGESDISFDGDHFVFVGNARFVFVYTISTDTVSPRLDTAGHGFDSVYITPDNNVTVTYFARGTGRFQGIELYDGQMNFLRQVTSAGGHMDLARDDDGSEVLVWANSGDPLADPNCPNGVVKVRLSDARRTCLMTLDWSLAIHVSGTDDRGWAFVGTYAPGDPDPGSDWPAYTNELLQVKLDGSEVRRLAHHRSRPFDSYVYTPKMSTSRDGSRVIFNSNYGQVGLGDTYTDAYIIDLEVEDESLPDPDPEPEPSPVSEQDGSAPANPESLVTRYEQDDPAVALSGNWLPNGLASHSESGAVLAMDAGARVSFPFHGTGVSWIGYTDPWSGVARVLLNGELVDTIDTYSTPGTAQQTVWSVTGLEPDTHLLEIEVAGSHVSASGGSWVWIDAFEVIPGPVAAEPAPVGTAPEAVWEGTERFEEDDASVGIAGTWSFNGLGSHSGNGAVLSGEAGARVSFVFAGTGVRWIGYGDPWSGIARVFVDGEFHDIVDTYRAESEAQIELFAVTGLESAVHEIVVEVAAERHADSAGVSIWVDAFDVQPSAAAYSLPSSEPGQVSVVVQESDAAVALQGTWHGNDNALHTDGSAVLAMDAGAQVTFSFTGTGASWIGYRDPWSGIAQILLDGVPVEEIDTSNSESEARRTLYAVDGLPFGPHTLTVRVTGRAGPVSTGSWIWVDAFERR